MKAEFNVLQRNGTWSLVPPCSDMNIISIKRCKARLVGNGFHQHERLGYTKTFSLIVKYSTIRIVLALAVPHKWLI